MLKQATQTLFGRSRQSDADTDPYYLSDSSPEEQQTVDDEDGTDNRQDDQQDLRSTVDRLARDYETLNQRLSDKDRYIGQLQRENQILNSGLHSQSAGRQPKEPDPVLDEETAALFAQSYEKDPQKALIALAEHIDSRSRSRGEAEKKQQAAMQQITTKLQSIERNILRQVDLAVRELGSDAEDVIGDFLDVVRRGDGSAEDFAGTWLGQKLQRDRALAETTEGVYLLIEREVAKRQGNTVPQGQPQERRQHRPTSAGVSRPTAPSRHVSDGYDGQGDEPSVEDRISEAIVNAARGDDAQQRAIFHG